MVLRNHSLPRSMLALFIKGEETMKTITIRNFALSNNKKQAFYQGKEIVDCGLSGEPRHYWVIVLDKKANMFETHTLYMAEPVQVII